MTFTIAHASAADLTPILALLARTDLPPDGLRDHLATTLVARSGQAIVGCAALELYGAAALLRSVAVEPSHQGQGLGQQLTRAALDLARQHGVHEVYLLTTTAGAFFPRFGFEPVARTDVPAAVQQSVEFTSACPVSALVMRLRLDS
jgi:amino-acid N-acetyltransferase